MSNDKQYIADKFTKDSRIFMLSLNDAYKCTSQISDINTSKELTNKHLDILLNSYYNKDMILYKNNNSEIYTDNSHNKIIFSNNKTSLNSYLMFKFSFLTYIKHLDLLNINSSYDYYTLDKNLDKIISNKKTELENLIKL